jgi:tetratricopeptide (TPR) repeat protein
MELLGSQERARIKRAISEQAVELAMQSRWAEAAEVNGQLIETYPKEIAAHNRLGKALMELARYEESREAYNHALRIDPTNGIAQKNLQRIETLMEDSIARERSTAPVDPAVFIEEAGRTTITSLIELAPTEVLAKMNAGDRLELRVEGTNVLCYTPSGDALGRLEPKLRQRLIRLIGLGNEYSAVVTAVDEEALRVIIRETHRDPSMGSRTSFPASGDAFRGYVRDSLLRYELDEDDDDDLDDNETEANHDVDLVVSDIASDAESGPDLVDADDEQDEEEEGS